MVCPNCNATVDTAAASCAACGALAPATSDATAPAPITAESVAATARQVGEQLDQARRSLPYGSIHIAAAGFAVAALLLSLTSWGARASWLLTVLAVAGIAATAAADLRRRGAFSTQSWPLSAAYEASVAAATLVLLAATTLVSLHMRLGSLLWVLALAGFAWGAWPLLRSHLDLRPARLLGGYRALAIAGVVLFLAMLTQTWGQASSSLIPGYGYTCTELGCADQYGYGFGAMTIFGVVYQGTSVEWAEIIVVALLAGLAALLVADSAEAHRPAWLRFVPVATAALTVAWLVWSMSGSVLVKGGTKQLAWWLAIAALAAYAAGSALIAAGQDDGEYAPARLVRRLRGNRAATS